MATLTSPKKQKSYRIQISMVQVMGLGFLFTLSLIFSFYIGLVSGKSILTEQAIASLQNNKEKPLENNPTLAAEHLSFFQSMKKENQKQPQKQTFSTEQLEKLRKTTDRITQKQQLATTPKQPLAKKTPSPQPQKVASVASKKNPPLVAANLVGTYTLQVFTSSNQKKAETWVKRLKENGHLDAYLNPYVNRNKQTLYRVRVAKTSKPSAESLAEKLRQLDFIDHVQITRL